ncbi:DUF4097 family beta strand repeat-containing protein [Spirillospora sp. NPDC029432]|uniref:DUF4097 family beta strand repeat-containing protein n=1 Tax=Spirillospora sp. NPDC029432 TaxID=3154599 RepID=UPI003456B978
MTGAAGPASPAGGAGERRRGIWVALAIATAAVVVLPAGLYAWGTAIRRTASVTDTYRRPVTDVEIDAGGARVTVGPGEAGRVRVVARLSWALHRPRVERIWAGELLLIRYECETDGWTYPGLRCDADIDVQVPQGVRVRAQSGSGPLRLRGLGGDLRLETRSGTVELADVRGRIWARAGSGEITGRGLAAPSVEAEVGSGRLDFAFASPPRYVKASAGSGAVRVTVPNGSYYRVGAEAGSGRVRIDPALNDRSSPRAIVAKTGSGALTIGYPADR